MLYCTNANNLYPYLFIFLLIMYFLDVFICSGDYGESVTLETLKDFHRRRVQVLAEAGADILAFETTPNKLEAQVTLLLKISKFAQTLNIMKYYIEAPLLLNIWILSLLSIDKSKLEIPN